MFQNTIDTHAHTVSMYTGTHTHTDIRHTEIDTVNTNENENHKYHKSKQPRCESEIKGNDGKHHTETSHTKLKSPGFILGGFHD